MDSSVLYQQQFKDDMHQRLVRSNYSHDTTLNPDTKRNRLNEEARAYKDRT